MFYLYFELRIALCRVLGLEEMSRNLMEKGHFLPGHYSFFLKKKSYCVSSQMLVDSV